MSSNIMISKGVAELTCPGEGIIEVENITGGKLTCETRNSKIATCEVIDDKIIVKSGTKQGDTTILIKAVKDKEEFSNVVYVNTYKGSLLNSVNANGYQVEYNRLKHHVQ